MIADECKLLREQLEEVAKAEARENVVEQLNSRREEIIDLRDTLLLATKSLEAISRRTDLVGDLDPTKCIERVRKIRESLQADPLSITEGRDFTNMKKAFEKFAVDGHAVIEATWNEYVPKFSPSVDTIQLAQAEKMSDCKAMAFQLKNRAKYAIGLTKTPPTDVEQLSEIEAAWEDIRRMMAELPPAAKEPKVQKFLQDANSPEGAALDSLSEDVLDWLAKHKIADKYRIRTM